MIPHKRIGQGCHCYPHIEYRPARSRIDPPTWTGKFNGESQSTPNPRERKTTRALVLQKEEQGIRERHRSIKSSQPWEKWPFQTKEGLGQFFLGFFQLKDEESESKSTKLNQSDSIDGTEQAKYLKIRFPPPAKPNKQPENTKGSFFIPTSNNHVSFSIA